MLKSLQLDDVGPVRGLSATFGERLNVFTGDNGLGKSFLLDVCFWALTGTWPAGRSAWPVPNGKKHLPRIAYDIKGKSPTKKEPKTATFDFRTQTWTRPKGRPFKPGLVIYASVDGGFAIWDPARNYWRDPTTGMKEGDDIPRAFQFTPEALANGIREGERVLCSGLVQDWVTWFYEQPAIRNGKHSQATDLPPFELLANVVSLLSHPSEPMSCGEPKRLYVDQPRKYPVLTMPYGEVAYPHWSAGVRRVVSFAYLLVWAWHEHQQAARLRQEEPENRIVLLVDEIEAHLHPRWQRTIVPALLHVVQKLQKTVEIQLFAATHSPLILASLEPHFNPVTDRLFWFDMHQNAVRFRECPWAIHGDVVGWLTSDLFGLRQARSREAEMAIEAAESLMRNDISNLPPHLNTKAKIEHELKRTLPGLDPFWPRWMMETKK